LSVTDRADAPLHSMPLNSTPLNNHRHAERPA
jgi:hypothetical protein